MSSFCSLIFFTAKRSVNKINYDGGYHTVIISDSSAWIRGIGIDLDNRRLCWTNLGKRLSELNGNKSIVDILVPWLCQAYIMLIHLYQTIGVFKLVNNIMNYKKNIGPSAIICMRKLKQIGSMHARNSQFITKHASISRQGYFVDIFANCLQCTLC